MFAIIGAAGNVGFSTSSALRQAGVPVTAILRDAAKAARLSAIGCQVVIADLQDPGSVAPAIANADAVQVILPLRPQTNDPAADLRHSGQSILEALNHACPKRMLVISDYGAHVAEDIGMPGIFHDFEAQFRQLGGHKLILRSAEHMHNWGRAIPQAIASGILPSLQDPIDMPQPTISAQDLGQISARLLLRPANGNAVDVIHAEGPHRYSASDVAAALSQLLGRTLIAQAVPRSQWDKVFERMPSSLADLLIKANEAKNKGGLVDVEPNTGEPIYGATELINALRPLLPPQ
jgi:NAD(P)H dehydrogenase (quinone)